MSRYVPGIDSSGMLRIAEVFKEKCLLNGESLFGNEKIWTSTVNAELIQYFVNNPDESNLNFIDKLKIQLAPASSSAKKLAAEILYVLNLCPTNTGQNKKREIVKEVYEWSGSSLNIESEYFSDKILHGVGSGGVGFNTFRWKEFSYFVNFIELWAKLELIDRDSLLSDSWGFGKWLESVPENEARQFRHMLVYMLFPDDYERIFGGIDRALIISAYTGARKKDILKNYKALDYDKKFNEIRSEKERLLGLSDIDFYQPPLDVWRPENEKVVNDNFFPENITRDHVLSAIGKIDSDGIPRNARSTTYDLIHDDKKYPPKYVLSIANLFANGAVLNRDSFEGGLGTPCFQLLERLGFEIIEKSDDQEMTYYSQLMMFIEQSRTSDLKVRQYERTFNDLKVKVSFGQGVLAKVPWIAFLGQGQVVPNGVYPVYLLFKEQRKLLLAKGISVSNKPSMEWPAPTGETIKEYFQRELNEAPYDYGDSYIYKAYDIDALPGQEQIDSDLNDLVDQYNQLFKSTGNLEVRPFVIVPDFANSAGLKFDNKLISRFKGLLLTKPFVILTGLSGSGKTKVAQAFAAWICEDTSQYLVVPVGSDWTNREPLLGYPNSLNTSEYIIPDSGVVDLLMQATANPSAPYFLILDEMNLSHVERYFSDFLSLMESGEELKMHSSNEIKSVPRSLAMPGNLFIIGTVNIDETTYMFSPKVLDRAGVIEFRVNSEDMSLFLKNPVRPDLDEITGLGSSMAIDFVRIATENAPRYKKQEALNNELLLFFDQLKRVGAEFGYRTAFEISRFAGIISALTNGDCSHEDIVDAAIIQKLLPKLHGSRNQVVPVLEKLAELCLQDDAIANVKGKLKSDHISGDDPEVKYPLSFEKIHRMHSRAIKDGFTSFAEA